MKVTGIVGSPRGVRGNTGRLMLEVLAGAEAEGAATEAVGLPGGTVLPCRACDTCHKKGDCPQDDDFAAGAFVRGSASALARPVACG